MWLYTRNGFISVVAHRNMPDRVLVRARRQRDLDSVLAAYVPKDGSTDESWPLKPFRDASADYEWRVVMPKALFAVMAGNMAADVDYPNFKGECGKRRDPAYSACLHDTWEVAVDNLCPPSP